VEKGDFLPDLDQGCTGKAGLAIERLFCTTAFTPETVLAVMNRVVRAGNWFVASDNPDITLRSGIPDLDDG